MPIHVKWLSLRYIKAKNRKQKTYYSCMMPKGLPAYNCKQKIQSFSISSLFNDKRKRSHQLHLIDHQYHQNTESQMTKLKKGNMWPKIESNFPLQFKNRTIPTCFTNFTLN